MLRLIFLAAIIILGVAIISILVYRNNQKKANEALDRVQESVKDIHSRLDKIHARATQIQSLLTKPLDGNQNRP